MLIVKRFTFEAAHHLPQHLGKCHNMHGHSYRLEVGVIGPVITEEWPSKGMVMDFADLKEIVSRAVISRFDHRVINEVTDVYPTAENLCLLFWQEIERGLKEFGQGKLAFVRLWETENSYAQVGTEVG